MNEVEKSKPQIRTSSNYLPSLDGWRGIAVIAVILNHGNQALLPNGMGLRFPIGACGVWLFFAISGILIVSKLSEEKEKFGQLDIKMFYWRRFFRLIPALFVYLVFCKILSLFGILRISNNEIIACFLFYRNYFSSFQISDAGHYTGHFWSLSVEWQFYFIIPFLILGFKRNKLLFALPLVALLIEIWRAIESRYDVTKQLFPTLIFDVGRTDLCLDYLLWGAWFGLLIASNHGRNLLARFLSLDYIQYILFISLVVVTAAPIPSKETLFGIITPCLLISTILRYQNILGKALENPLLKWIGKISYSLYIWQQLFLIQRGSSDPLALPPLLWFQNFPLGIPCTILFGVLSYYFIENPTRKLGYKLLKLRK